MNERRHGYWQNVTGSVEPEDSNLLSAANRELHEETGLQASSIIELDLQFNFIDQYKNQVTEYCFLAEISMNQPLITLDPSEHQSYKWIELTELSSDTFHYESNFIAASKAMELLND